MSGMMDMIGLGGSSAEVVVESAGGTLAGAFNFDSSSYAVLVPLFYLLTSMKAFEWTQKHVVDFFNHRIVGFFNGLADKCSLPAMLRMPQMPRVIGHGNMMTAFGACLHGFVLIALLHVIAIVVHMGDIPAFVLCFILPLGYTMYKHGAKRFDYFVLIGFPLVAVYAHGAELFQFKLLISQQLVIALAFSLVAQPRLFDWVDEVANGRVDTVDRNGPTKAGRLLHAFVFVAVLHLTSSLLVGEALMIEDSA